MTAEIRFGDWQDVLADVEVDVSIFDPPYGDRTHSGTSHGRSDTAEGLAVHGLGYDHLTPSGVREIVEHWSPRTRGWMVMLTSHDLVGAWESAFNEAGRYCFAPLPVVMKGMNVRLQGDGPSSWCVWLMVSRRRTKEAASWGTLPGAYVGPPNRSGLRQGGKPLWLMRDLVRDYSRPGDLVCDAFAGGGTTLRAALDEGRSCIGAERDKGAFDIAARRVGQVRDDGPLFALLDG